ncbi:hypothetical protein RJ639_030337 [Escallonia herrerae]|uniref:UspA domain-containing protein n=1 Tax=Escallonia herrerae TaxID=1293975 RepID=A0AA89BBR7_9ASTE|nr:hypothetical protein RJ639_030337 [Escallonia herrerae]
MMSPEIVEIGEDSKSFIASRDQGAKDVFVAVGKDDLKVVKWALDHAVSPGARVYLVHVFPPISYISTPGNTISSVFTLRARMYFWANRLVVQLSNEVSNHSNFPVIVGRLSKSQLSKELVQFYMTEENNRRRNLLQKYIRLCTDAKVAVDTVLLESNATAKAILDLIPVLNITNLVVGTKRLPSSRYTRDVQQKKRREREREREREGGVGQGQRRRFGKGLGKAEFLQKNAPDFCEVTIVYDGEKVMDCQLRQVAGRVPSGVAPSHREPKPEIRRQSERNFFDCMCFSPKFN